MCPINIDKKRHIAAFNILEKESRTSGFYSAIGNLSDFQLSANRDGNTTNLVSVFKEGDEVTEIVEYHEQVSQEIHWTDCEKYKWFIPYLSYCGSALLRMTRRS